MMSSLDLRSQEILLGTKESLDRQYAAFRFVLEKMNNRAEAADAKLIVLEITPFQQGVKIPPADVRIDESYDDVGCQFLSLSRVSRELRDQGVEMHIPNNGHLNAAANRATAAFLADAITASETGAR